MDHVRKDYILLDDKLGIMVVPHKKSAPQWFTYDEIDEMRLTLSPRVPRMLLAYNEMMAWTKRARIEQIKLGAKEVYGEESDRADL